MSIVYTDECLDCKSMGLPCYGRSCINRNVAHFYRDKCKQEVDTLHPYKEEQWCANCVLSDLGEVEIDE